MAARRTLAAVLAMLAAVAVAVAAARVPQPGSQQKPVQLIIFFAEDVRGIGAATERVRTGTAEKLVADAEAQRAAAASGPGAYAAIAAMGRPFEITYVTPYEVDPQGKWVPGTNAVVELHPQLSGRGDRAIDIADAIIQAIEAQPGVRYVIDAADIEVTPDVVCGPGAPAPCPAGQCCRASTATCGTGPDFCGDECMPNYGFVPGLGCTTPVLERKRVLNTGLLGSTLFGANQPNLQMIDATFTNPTNKKLDTAAIGPFGVARYNLAAMVWDSGVGPHHDLYIIGGRNTAIDGQPETAFNDVEQHGTHVAGIIGSRNDGVGSWGVLPNAKIYSARMLVAHGVASAPNVLEPLRQIQATNNANSIAVINMSFGSIWVDSPAKRALKADLCDAMNDIADRWGIVLVASAGNAAEAVNLEWKFPLFCKAAIIVTALDPASCKTTTVKNPDGTKTTTRRCRPGWFSNWIDAGASQLDKLRTVAAPGVGVYSTVPAPVNYRKMDGTSMAAPHVTGIALKCFVAGECQFGTGVVGAGLGTTNKALILSYFYARNLDPSYKWTDDGQTWVAPDGTTRHYGYLAWAGRW